MSDFPPIVFTEDNLKAIQFLHDAKKLGIEGDDKNVTILTQAITLNSQYARAYDFRASIYNRVGLCYKSALDIKMWFDLTIPSEFRGQHCISHILGLRRSNCDLNSEESKVVEAIVSTAGASIRRLEEESKVWREVGKKGPLPLYTNEWDEGIWFHKHGDYQSACGKLDRPGFGQTGEQGNLQKQYAREYVKAYEKTGAPRWYS